MTSWLSMTRRRLLGGLLVGAGGALSACRMSGLGERTRREGRILLDGVPNRPPGLDDAAVFSLLEALYGRRSRRFAKGATIPDGVLAYASTEDPQPLSPLEQMLVLTATAGNTGWQHMIYRAPSYAPDLSRYTAAAGGRTFPSPAGWNVADLFFTDDDGVYSFSTRDAPSLTREREGKLDLNAWLDAHRMRLRTLSPGRLRLPAREPYMDGHNTWCANVPGSTLIIPVADVAQTTLNALCFLVSNGYCIRDDVHDREIPGLARFDDLVDRAHPWPLSVVEKETLTMSTAELTTSCYAGMLMLQALGLGGWMFSGIDMLSVLGASGNPEVPGLGFSFATDPRWPVPNVTGLPGVFEGLCPPHHEDMHAAMEALAERKFGPGGPYHPETPGPWQDTAKVRAAAKPYTPHFKECVATMAQYVFDTFGKFPGTVPTMYILTYLQAHHLDLGFYDQYFKPGAYLETHAHHQARWHAGGA